MANGKGQGANGEGQMAKGKGQRANCEPSDATHFGEQQNA
jgi:hypothetical protein